MQTITTEEKLRRIFKFLKSLHFSIMKGSAFNAVLISQRCKLDKLNLRVIPVLLNEGFIEAIGRVGGLTKYKWTKRKARMFPGGKHFTEGMPKYLLDNMIIEKSTKQESDPVQKIVQTVNKVVASGDITFAEKLSGMEEIAKSIDFKGVTSRPLTPPQKVENITDAERVALHKILDHVIMVEYTDSVAFDDLTVMVAKQIKEKL